MSRKPDTPRDSDGPAGMDTHREDIATGRRFSGNADLLRIERELVADGAELGNRAIPIEYHAQERDYTAAEIESIIAEEVDHEHPNPNLIGYLNEVKASL